MGRERHAELAASTHYEPVDLVNARFIHRDQVKVTDVEAGEEDGDGPRNRQPFLMATQIIEPLPFVRDGVLYWKVVVMPQDAAGIAYQAFVDAGTHRVWEVRSDQELARFLAAGPAGLTPAGDRIEGVVPAAAPAAPPGAPGEAQGLGATASEIRALIREIRERLDRLEARLQEAGMPEH